jgi:hypothetical protein
MAAGRDPRFRFRLALAYLLWSILPHFHVLFHSHAGGAPHFHASLTSAQTALANRVLDGLGPAGLQGMAPTEVGGEEKAAPVPAPGDVALAAGRDASLHGHYWEDANLAGALSFPTLAAMTAVLVLFFAVRYLPPGLRPSGAAPARGPPSLLFA